MSVRSLNKVLLIGNLTRDPVLRYTGSGTAVCSFGIATNRSWTPSEGGEKQERVEYHNIVAWAKLADICGQLLHKGDNVYCEGRMQTRDWKGDDGQERKTTEVVIDNMILLKSRQGGGAGSGAGSYDEDMEEESRPAAPKKKAAAKKEEAPSDDVEDVEDIADDVPF